MIKRILAVTITALLAYIISQNPPPSVMVALMLAWDSFLMKRMMCPSVLQR